MAEKDQQQSPLPLAPSFAYSRSDTEAAGSGAAATPAAVEHRGKNKRTKCILYILLFTVFQTGIIVLSTFTVMKIRTPKFRLQLATFHDFNVGTPTNPSLNITMNAELNVKNTNFGRFKFGKTLVYFFYQGRQVAEVSVPKGKANWRSTKRFEVAVNVTIMSGPSQEINSQLASDLTAGVVPLTSQAKMRGNVRVMMALKKSRSTDMNCSVDILTATRQISIVCK